MDPLADAAPRPYWLDQPGAPAPTRPLAGRTRADLAVVGGGFGGLWTALLAKEREPSRDVILLEGRTTGWAASGRNGGFCAASLTHGLANGTDRFPDEIDTLERLGRDNLDGIEETLRRHHIDCGFERTGELTVAVAPWQLPAVREERERALAHGHDVEPLDAEALRAQLDSPSYLGGMWQRDGIALLDPARLARGLHEACRRLGVRIHERSAVRSIGRGDGPLRLDTTGGSVMADQVALCTGAYSPLVGALRRYVVPVYDYVLMTEPLSAAQLASIGWRNRQGVSDAGNQFHYYRLTADDRILWGGYDAVYYNGGRITRSHEQREQTARKLAEHFHQTFPQLDGIRFTHRWGGVIDTCSRFCAFFGTARGGRLAYAGGYTGLGVGATRFGGQVLLDLLDGQPTERTELRFVRSKPVRFPPEPARSGVIQLTRWSIARADACGGRRNGWLRLLDACGVGFDS